MNKDFEIKKEPQYSYAPLRKRITEAVKRIRDDAEELDLPQAKTLPLIPVTGYGKEHKYFNNKSGKEF
jgi:hypothetical protein